MRRTVRVVLTGLLTFLSTQAAAQEEEAATPFFPSDDPVIRAIWEEGVERSQVMELGRVMMDEIGPRLTGSPAMARANDWAVEKYKEWGIEARKEQYGTWRGWERGTSHIDLVSPRVRSLEGMAAAWSPAHRRARRGGRGDPGGRGQPRSVRGVATGGGAASSS